MHIFAIIQNQANRTYSNKIAFNYQQFSELYSSFYNWVLSLFLVICDLLYDNDNVGLELQ